jgi:hypothetical protein
MNNRLIIQEYKNMIRSLYWGIVSRMNDLLNSKYNSSINGNIGGCLQKNTLTINNIKYIIIHNKEFNDINFHLVTIENSVQFGILLFQKNNKDIALFQEAYAYGGCNYSHIENLKDSKLITKLIIKICKKKKIKRIIIEDNSIYKIILPNTSDFEKFTRGRDFDLDIYYTLITGKPWYTQFGFKNLKNKDYKNMIHNYNILNNKKVRDFSKNIFIDQKFIKLYDQYLDLNITVFNNILFNYDNDLFLHIYDDLFDKLNLIKFHDKHYYLDL